MFFYPLKHTIPFVYFSNLLLFTLIIFDIKINTF